VAHAAAGPEVELLHVAEAGNRRNQFAEVDAAVGNRRHAKIEHQHEVSIRLLGRQVRAPFLEQAVGLATP